MKAAEGGLAFSFVEGALIRAVREGWWVLLDEINLAPPEVSNMQWPCRCRGWQGNRYKERWVQRPWGHSRSCGALTQPYVELVSWEV